MKIAEASVVRHHVIVDAPIDRAFTVFTERFGDFKPPEHNLLGAPIAETTFEPRVGGHISDRAVDGTECHWARVLAYEPPDRVVFSWDISPHWQIETNPDHTSGVEVRFIAETPERTRLELEHRQRVSARGRTASTARWESFDHGSRHCAGRRCMQGKEFRICSSEPAPRALRSDHDRVVPRNHGPVFDIDALGRWPRWCALRLTGVGIDGLKLRGQRVGVRRGKEDQ